MIPVREFNEVCVPVPLLVYGGLVLRQSSVHARLWLALKKCFVFT